MLATIKRSNLLPKNTRLQVSVRGKCLGLQNTLAYYTKSELFYQICMYLISANIAREALQKGKAQYCWPPCTNEFWSSPFHTENITNIFFSKQAISMRSSTVLSLAPPYSLMLPGSCLGKRMFARVKHASLLHRGINNDLKKFYKFSKCSQLKMTNFFWPLQRWVH